ncbi:hypothetical protein N574_0117355 [Lactiplantibacillus plantarum 2165]|nr:hypothetical protein N574_0117355 [Lactiplantibacillus plantarum 2165]
MAKTSRPSKAKQQALVHQLIGKIDAQPEDYHAYYELVVLLTAGQDFEQAEALAMKALGKFDHQQPAATTCVMRWEMSIIKLKLMTKRYHIINKLRMIN